MKLILLALFLVFSNAFMLRGPMIPISDEDAKANSDIEDFFTAYWAFFGLNKPEQVLKCYDPASAKLYFKYQDLVNDLVQHAERRESHKVHLDFIKLAALGKALKPSGDCAAKTQDIADLLDALNITDRNPELLAIQSFIHFQAEIGELSKALPPINDAIARGNFTEAGELSASLGNCSEWQIQNEGTALLALKGLWNGVHIGLDLPDAASILDCWKNDTADIRLQFIYGLAHAVASGKKRDAAYNTEKWYAEKGKDLINQIPEDVWQCWANSTDVQKESDKLQINITSPEFFDKAKKFVFGHQEDYWKIQKIIKENLEEHNFIHAGAGYASIMEHAARTK